MNHTHENSHHRHYKHTIHPQSIPSIYALPAGNDSGKNSLESQGVIFFQLTLLS